MQTTTAEGLPLSAGFADAVDSPQQEVLTRLRIGWGGDDDFSGDYAEVPCKSARVERQLAGDLPDAVRAVEGFSAASFSAEIGPFDIPIDGELKPAPWWYSRFNAESPLFDLEPIGALLTFDVGLRTDAGVEWVRQFTGKVRSLNVRSSDATASLTALDFREKIRSKVRLPMVASPFDDPIQPSLAADWIINETLQANGVYPIPPARDRCLWYASLLGSTMPSVGKLIESNTVDSNGVRREWAFTTDGPFGPVLDIPSDAASLSYEFDSSYPIGPQPGRAFLVQGWIYAGSTSTAPIMSIGPEGSAPGDAFIAISGGTVIVGTTRYSGATLQVLGGPTLVGSPAWHFVGAHVAYSGASVTATFCVDGVVSSDSETNPINQMWGPDWTVTVLSNSGPGSASLPRSAWQISAETSPPTTWDSEFSPTAVVERSTNEISVILPADDQDGWDLLKDLGEAEFAAFFFDEHGIFRWWSSTHWGLPETQTIAKTVTAQSALIDLAYSDAVDQIRNHITIGTTQITYQPPQVVWTLGEAFEVPAQSTVTIWANFENPVWQLGTEFQYVVSSGESYIVARSADDGGGHYVFDWYATITAFAQSAKIQVTNTSTDTMWLVAVGRETGISLWGTPIASTSSATTAYEAEPSDADIAKRGDQPLNISATRWRQSMLVSAEQAVTLRSQLSEPRPVITDMPIVADPRLQLGDRITVVDSVGMQLNEPFRIAGISLSVNESGCTQNLTCRQSPTDAIWGESDWGADSWA